MNDKNLTHIFGLRRRQRRRRKMVKTYQYPKRQERRKGRFDLFLLSFLFCSMKFRRKGEETEGVMDKGVHTHFVTWKVIK